MNKIAFIGIYLVISFNSACLNDWKGENWENSKVSATPTVNPIKTSEKQIDKEKAKKHYWEGLRLKSNYDIPDNSLKAIEEFKKSAESDTKDTMPYWQMTEIYNELKNFSEVEKCFREILRIDSKDLRAQWGLAYVLVWDLKRYEEGLKEAQIAKEKKATYSWLIEETIGKAYEGMGDIPNALKHYKQYLRDFRGMKETDSTLYKNMQKKVTELEKTLKTSNQNSHNNNQNP